MFTPWNLPVPWELYKVATLTFSGIRMKVRLEGASSIVSLRCPLDDTVLLISNEDDVTLQNCEHFRWHGGPDEIIENEKNENEGDNDEEDEESWNEVLNSYIAKVSIGGAAFYLLHLEKALKEG